MSGILLYIAIAIGLVIGFAILLIVLIFGWIFYATKELPKVASTFFSLITQGKIVEAYHSTSIPFQASTSQADLVQFLQENALLNYLRFSWSSRSFKTNQGSLEGTVTNKSGGKIPLKIHFIKENDTWKIYALEKPKSRVIEDKKSQQISGLIENGVRKKHLLPTQITAKQLAYDTLICFVQTVETKDFTEFYNSISSLWQQQTSMNEMQSLFKQFINKQLNLSGVVKGRVNFVEPPAINQNNWLHLRGKVADALGYSSTLNFDFQYMLEAKNWKLVKIRIHIEGFNPEEIHQTKPKHSLQMVDGKEFTKDLWADRN